MKETIKISKGIYEKLSKRAQEKGFGTEEYVELILKQVIEKLEKEKGIYSREDEEKVKKRLKELGYL